TTQNQWINLTVGGGTRLMGGLPALRDYYNFTANPGYTVASVQAFGASALAGAPNPALLVPQKFDEFKPESMQSFEVGYKGLFAKRVLVDVYAYWAKYKDFLSSVSVLQANSPVNSGNPLTYLQLLSASTRTGYSISVNTPGDVKTNGWGASVEYLMPHNFSISGNLYSDIIGPLPTGFVSYFNTPKYRTNIAFGNSGFGSKNRFGFGIVYRWTNTFNYEGTFGSGHMPYTRTVDAMVSLRIPDTKSMIKLGATNLFNVYYQTGWGNPGIGGLYYISYGWNVF
ncbi:MAG: hypothetical protein RLZZ28_1690, partial [Bacteroidota bacterium]